MESEDNIFLEAVCGAGKTEICLDKVITSIREKKKVGWCIPRREVVIELADRIQSYYPNLKVVKVCEGYTEDLEGDLIVCTTHQLFRYVQYFDLLILDEPDAFPFSNSVYLKDILEVSCTGQFIFLSATKDQYLLEKLSQGFLHYVLNERPSGILMPVPMVKQSIVWFLYFLQDLHALKGEKGLIFCPTIKYAQKIAFLLNAPLITSKTENKEDILKEFRQKSKGYLVCTSVLERGVTFNAIHVFVLWMDHSVWSTSSLIQIAGRVGRGMKPLPRKCYFYGIEQREEVKQCIQTLTQANQSVESVLNP